MVQFVISDLFWKPVVNDYLFALSASLAPDEQPQGQNDECQQCHKDTGAHQNPSCPVTDQTNLRLQTVNVHLGQ